MAKMEWQEEKPEATRISMREAAPGFAALLDYLLDSSLSAKLEIATLKRILVEHHVQVDPELYRSIYLEEQQRELERAAGRYEAIAAKLERALARLDETSPYSG